MNVSHKQQAKKKRIQASKAYKKKAENKRVKKREKQKKKNKHPSSNAPNSLVIWSGFVSSGCRSNKKSQQKTPP
jgi:hypothetical protein